MTEGRARSRMLDKEPPPTEGEIAETIGPAAEDWRALRAFLAGAYPDVAPAMHWGGARYGWEVRYRKGARPLASLYPERGGLTVLVVLGAAELAGAEALGERLSPALRSLMGRTTRFHDGSWLWIDLPEGGTVEDIAQLVQLKRKPKPKPQTA